MTLLLKTGERPRFALSTPRSETSAVDDRFARLAWWIAATLRWTGQALAARRLRRAGLRELSRLDERTLRDIGLTRADLPGWIAGEVRGWRSLGPRR